MIDYNCSVRFANVHMLTLEALKSAFKFSPTASLILYPDNPAFTIAAANDVFLTASGLTEAIENKSFFDAFSEICVPELRGVIQSALDYVFHKKESCKTALKNVSLYAVESQKYRQLSCSCDIFPVLDANNEVGFIIMSFSHSNEISTDKPMPHHPIHLPATSSILESITDCFCSVDRNWIVTYWNKQAELMSGMPREKVIGRNLWEVYSGAVSLKFYSEYTRAMEKGETVHFEEYSSALNKWIEASCYPSSNGLSVYFKDITSRKNNEEQIIKERQKYQNLFSLSPIPMWVYDIETLKFLDVNDAAVQHYGYSREEFLSLTINDIRPKEDIPLLKEILKNTKRRHGHFNKNAVRHMKKSGEVIYVHVESNPIPFENRDARIVSSIDNTEKFAAEEALKRSEQRFRALIQDSSDLITIHNKQGDYQYISPSCTSVVGVDAAYFMGKNLFDFIHKDDVEYIRRQFCRLGTRKRVKVSSFRLQIGSRFIWMEMVLTNMCSDEAVAGIVINSRDITARVENEMKIKETADRYNVLLKTTSDAVWDRDLITNTVVWNKGIRRIFGYIPAEASTYNWWRERVHPDDLQRVENYLQQSFNGRNSKLAIEYRFRCADGSYKYTLDRAFLMYDKAGKPVRMIGAMQDISEQVKYLHALEQQNQRLREISWIQSHVVRAPLARIMGLSKVLSENTSDEIMLKELLSHMDHSASELDNIIRDIISKTDKLS